MIEDLLREAREHLYDARYCTSTEPLNRAALEALLKASGAILGGITPEGAGVAYIALCDAMRYVQLLTEVYESRGYPTQKWIELHRALTLIQGAIPIIGDALPGKAT